MADISSLNGRRVTLPGHFVGEVLIEGVRPVGLNAEIRVRLSSGELDEAFLTEDEIRYLLDTPEVSQAANTAVDAEKLRLWLHGRFKLVRPGRDGPSCLHGLSCVRASPPLRSEVVPDASIILGILADNGEALQVINNRDVVAHPCTRRGNPLFPGMEFVHLGPVPAESKSGHGAAGNRAVPRDQRELTTAPGFVLFNRECPVFMN